LIESGWPERTVRGFSLAQMNWVLRRSRQRRNEADQRALMIACAASAGGDAAQKCLDFLRRESGRLENEPAPNGESQTPLSAEDFDRMMNLER